MNEGQLSAFTLIALDAQTPEHLGLQELPSGKRVLECLRRGFDSFLSKGASFALINDLKARFDSPPTGLHLIYLMGHAWIEAETVYVAIRSEGHERVVPIGDVLRDLVGQSDPTRTLLFIDTCHAAAIATALDVLHTKLRFVVFGSAATEQAIALLNEKATRLALALSRALARAADEVDLVSVVASVTDQLRKNSLLPGQSVAYALHGPSVRLVRSGKKQAAPRESSVAFLRNALIGTGAILATMLLLTGWYYWQHALIDIDLNGLNSIATSISIVVIESEPATNTNRQLVEIPCNAGHVRFRVPTSDLILQVKATYSDGKRRALFRHLVLHRGVTPFGKAITLQMPPASEVLAHPDMSHIPVTDWIHGKDIEQETNAKAFWIDIAPPTVQEYLPYVERLMSEKKITPNGSILLHIKQAQGGLKAVGLQQVTGLGKDLGNILGVIQAATANQPAAPGDIVAGLIDMPCPTCPAPMTRAEAELYCAQSGKKLPTDLQWELAVRGVDGRDYPWGARFDKTKANVPGLPEKGETVGLTPVDRYAQFPSPFGLIDTVGNAGDWVEDESGSYDSIYMGATYRYNPEDATAYRVLPVTDDDLTIHEITARCVVD